MLSVFIAVVLLIIGAMLVSLGVLKHVYSREKEKAVVEIIEFLVSNYDRGSKGTKD